LLAQIYICELFLPTIRVPAFTPLHSISSIPDFTMGLYLILPLTLLAVVLVIGVAGFAQMLHAQKPTKSGPEV
jgi:hypothetical protein